jgi:hypothetical protein
LEKLSLPGPSAGRVAFLIAGYYIVARVSVYSFKLMLQWLGEIRKKFNETHCSRSNTAIFGWRSRAWGWRSLYPLERLRRGSPVHFGHSESVERVLGGVVVEAVGNQYQGFAKELLQGF